MDYQWIVSQPGARQHYAVPRALYRRGALDTFYTDAWCRFGCRLMRYGPLPLRAFANRSHSELPDDRVKSWNGRAFGHALSGLLRKRFGSPADVYRHHVLVGRAFAMRVAHELEYRQVDPARHAFFGFSTASLETLQYLDEAGVRSIVDQISPGPLGLRIFIEECKSWPGGKADVF